MSLPGRRLRSATSATLRMKLAFGQRVEVEVLDST
jgi:hypothetical protein